MCTPTQSSTPQSRKLTDAAPHMAPSIKQTHQVCHPEAPECEGQRGSPSRTTCLTAALAQKAASSAP